MTFQIVFQDRPGPTAREKLMAEFRLRAQESGPRTMRDVGDELRRTMRSALKEDVK